MTYFYPIPIKWFLCLILFKTTFLIWNFFLNSVWIIFAVLSKGLSCLLFLRCTKTFFLFGDGGGGVMPFDEKISLLCLTQPVPFFLKLSPNSVDGMSLTYLPFAEAWHDLQVFTSCQTRCRGQYDANSSYIPIYMCEIYSMEWLTNVHNSYIDAYAWEINFLHWSLKQV